MAVVQAHVHEERRPNFWRRSIFSLDHKVIGIQYLVTSMAMGLMGGLLAMLMRLALGWPEASGLTPASFMSAVTMHGTIMTFFVLSTALTGGFGNFLIPLQIGARDMAYPFLNMVSFWLFPISLVVMLASYFVPGGPASAGWTAYPPLSVQGGVGQALWLISLAILIIAFLFGSLNYISTVLQLRTQGMSLLRMPLTVWGLFITAILSLLSFPMLLAASIMLLFDLLGGTSFFLPFNIVIDGGQVTAAGGDPLLYQHLFWFLGHPEVYILILPAMGMVSDILANNARRPIFGYKTMVLSMAVIAVLSFLVWGHHMFVSGMHPLLGTAFMTTTLVIAIPSAIKTFHWLATLWRGKLRLTPQMLFSIGFVSLFVTGGLTGLVLGSPALDMYVHDTYFVVAHFHFVMASASLFGIFAGLYHWFPKMFGRKMNERLGRIHFWIALPATYATFFPMHFAGIGGMMRRIYSTEFYEYLARFEGLNQFISIAAFIMGAAHLLFIVNFVWSLKYGERAERNPWQATTLEWETPSPPPHGNFEGELPEVHRWAYDYSVPGAQEDYIPQTRSQSPVATPGQ